MKLHTNTNQAEHLTVKPTNETDNKQIHKKKP